jgi:hypothetical protein
LGKHWADQTNSLQLGDHHRDAPEGGGNRSSIVSKVRALSLEQIAKFRLQFAGAAITFRHVAFEARGHRPDESIRRGWRAGGVDLDDMSDQSWVIRDPVADGDTSTRPGKAPHLLGDVVRPVRKHGAKNANDMVKTAFIQLPQIGCVANLKPAICELFPGCSSVAGSEKIAGDVDAERVGPKPGRGQSSGSIAASRIQNLEPSCDSERFDERFATFSVALCDAYKIAHFPKRFVRIHRCLPRLHSGFL